MPKTREEIDAKNVTRTLDQIERNQHYEWNDKTSSWELKQGASRDDDIRVGLL